MLENSETFISFSRWYLAIFFSAVALFYSLRIVRLKRQTQQPMIFAGPRFCSTWWNHMAFRLFRALIWLVCVLLAFEPALARWLLPFPAMQHSAVIGTGLLLLTLGFVATASLHLNFAEHWRSGIDPRGPAQMLTDGVYAYSRNPMFIGVALAQLGFFFALPSAFSLLCLVIGLSALYRQTLAEEAHLAQAFPDNFAEYCSQVRRWL